MVPNPCCCMTLQSGVTVMAIIDIILDILNVLAVALAIGAFVGLKNDRISSTATDNELDVGIGVLSVSLIFAILGLLMSIRLYYGAKKRDLRNCKIWLFVSAIILTITIILNIVSGTAGEVDTLNVVSSIIDILYRLYMMWVVYAFIQELRSEGAMMGFQARLENGVGYTMENYPQQQPGAGIVYSTSPLPPYPQQQFIHNGGPQPQPNSMYNSNNYYDNSGHL